MTNKNMNREIYETLKRIIKHIKRYAKDEDIEEMKNDIIKVSDWIAEVKVMKKYHITYRDEFATTIRAENKEEALRKAQDEGVWELMLGEGHEDMFEIEEE